MKLIFLLSLSFVFITSCAMALSTNVISPTHVTIVKAKTEKVYPPLPEISENAGFPVLSAQGVLAVDLTSGITLYEKNPDGPLLPASTTKIVTALVSLDSYSLDQVLTVNLKSKVVGQKMGLYNGEQIKFGDLLYGLLVFSANDAAEALAQDFPGGRDAFINAMNVKAQELSMKNSHFENPAGLDMFSQVTTANDLIRVSEVAMRNPEFAKIVGTSDVMVTDVTGKSVYKLKNVNQLLGTVPGVLGVKTGWTENARENLVTYLERDNHKIMIAILGSQDRFGETKELINWIFSSYTWQEVKAPTQSP